ncbi:MAG: hypothetical protein ABI954_05285 [Pyrinomonadaceae bacterium]
MNFDSHLHNSARSSGSLLNGLTSEDIAALTHYPSLDKLFHDHDFSALNTMKSRLQTTFQNLERVILRGSGDDSKRAQVAAAAVRNALDFLEMLEQIRNTQTKS